MQFKSVLVTGGAGFIGSHLTDALLSQGCRVAIIDDLSTGRRENLNPAAAFHRMSTTDREGVRRVFASERPELVFQLAANTNVPRSVQDPLYDFQTLHGALNVIDACREFHARKIVYVSSSFIYGNTERRPIRESEPFIPISPYAISKRTIEHYLAFYRDVYDLHYALVRPATIYGPRQTCGAMADYIRKLSRGEQAEMYGDGAKTRDYVFVEDAVRAFLALPGVADDYPDPQFNLGTGIETSLNELYAAIAKLLDRQAAPIYMPARPGELEKYSVDSTKLTQATGWRAAHSLAQGLEKTVRYWQREGVLQ